MRALHGLPRRRWGGTAQMLPEGRDIPWDRLPGHTAHTLFRDEEYKRLTCCDLLVGFFYDVKIAAFSLFPFC